MTLIRLTRAGHHSSDLLVQKLAQVHHLHVHRHGHSRQPVCQQPLKSVYSFAMGITLDTFLKD